MILYHATTETKGKIILEEGYIKINLSSSFKDIPKECYRNSEQYVNLESEKGFVYLSNRISVAHDIVKSTVTDKDNYIYIFKLNIPENELLPDFDQAQISKCKAVDVMEILRECFSTRVNFNINLKKYNGEFTKIPSILNQYLFLERFPDTSIKIFDNIRNWVSNSHKNFTKEIEEKEEKFEKDLEWEKC